MNKNKVSAQQFEKNALLVAMVEANDKRIVTKDIQGDYHFNASFENSGCLQDALNAAKGDYPAVDADESVNVEKLYEQVFDHKSFTGRSGTMFGYEGLGSIYWHMISKLLLAVQENYQKALELDAQSKETAQLADYYYKVRAGIGFNKTPQNYGAFPTDPYSHTPKHSGAQQPGMTGQVKEEILTRSGELGICVSGGTVRFQPTLLRSAEFLVEPEVFRYFDVDGEARSITLSAGSLAFTFCQVPVVYQRQSNDASLEIVYHDGSQVDCSGSALDAELSAELFSRSGRVDRIVVMVPEQDLI